MRILAFAASLRENSLNKTLLGEAVEIAREEGVEVDVADFREFTMPLYDGDLQERSGLPEGALELIRRVEAADGIMIASPEYNYSVPGTLKNAIDWISRARPVPLRGKHGLLLSASISLVGGIRGLWHLRVPLEGLGTMLHPDMFALATAHQAFDEEGHLKDPALRERLVSLIRGYVDFGRRLSGEHRDDLSAAA